MSEIDISDEELLEASKALISYLRRLPRRSNAAEPMTVGQLRRDQAILASGMIAEYLTRAVGQQTRVHEVFTRLAHALSDLNVGTVDPMLQKKKVSNRPPDPTSLLIARSFVARLIDAKVRSGSTVETAALEVFQDLQDPYLLVGRTRKSRSDKSVQSSFIKWREILGDESKPDGKNLHGNVVAKKAFQRAKIEDAALLDTLDPRQRSAWMKSLTKRLQYEIDNFRNQAWPKGLPVEAVLEEEPQTMWLKKMPRKRKIKK